MVTVAMDTVSIATLATHSASSNTSTAVHDSLSYSNLGLC